MPQSPQKPHLPVMWSYNPDWSEERTLRLPEIPPPEARCENVRHLPELPRFESSKFRSEAVQIAGKSIQNSYFPPKYGSLHSVSSSQTQNCNFQSRFWPVSAHSDPRLEKESWPPEYWESPSISPWRIRVLPLPHWLLHLLPVHRSESPENDAVYPPHFHLPSR